MENSEICPICGQEVDAPEGVDPHENMNFCDECQRYVCTDCYNPLDRMCDECYEAEQIAKESQVS